MLPFSGSFFSTNLRTFDCGYDGSDVRDHRDFQSFMIRPRVLAGTRLFASARWNRFVDETRPSGKLPALPVVVDLFMSTNVHVIHVHDDDDDDDDAPVECKVS